MSAPNLDRNGRYRSVTVAFRMSHQEADELDALVAMSGMTKQDYITDRLLDRQIVVMPSSRLRRSLSAQVDAIYRELRRIRLASEMSPELCEVIETLAGEFQGLGPEGQESDTEIEASAIVGMSRK